MPQKRYVGRHVGVGKVKECPFGRDPFFVFLLTSIKISQQDLSLTLNGLDQKVLVISKHSTLHSPEQILAPKSPLFTETTHMSATTTPIPSKSDNNRPSPLIEKRHQKTENDYDYDDEAASIVTPPDTPSSAIVPKPDEGQTTAKPHDITANTPSTSSNLKEDNNNQYRTMEPTVKKKSMKSRLKHALKMNHKRSLNNVDHKSPSPATFSFLPSSSTPAPSLPQRSPNVDKRHSTSSSLLDYSNSTLLQQKHDSKARSWHPPSTSRPDQPSIHPLANRRSSPATTKTTESTLTTPSIPSHLKAKQQSSNNGPILDDSSPPLPTSRFLTAFQKFYQQQRPPVMETSTKEKPIELPSTAKDTASFTAKIKTRFNKSNTGSLSKASTTMPPQSLEPSSMSGSWSTFSQSFVPSCSVNYASQRRSKCRTDLKQQRGSSVLPPQKGETKVLVSTRSTTMLSTSNSSKNSSQYCVMKGSPDSTRPGYTRTTRLSSPPCPRQNETIPPISHIDTVLSHPTEHFAKRPPVTTTQSITNKKPSLSSSSSFSTSSTASCSSYLTLSSSTTYRSAKSLARIEKPFQQNITKRPKRGSRVRFLTMITVQETFASHEYDRASDPYAVCTRLTPPLAQKIKDELNTFKLEEMKVHRLSRCHTQFFL
ncbi:hypothetical protein [Absidia glauca]|uniref:Uncharacterized protein n=1 Tax=Absidia glauca TaxID=4829 RepID=A0A168LF51_ABSGL|nr:hypothetical protein [Absidia glauca]